MIWYICFFLFVLYWIIVETGSSMIVRTVAEKEDKFN